jgi:VWFA-related protein
MPHAPRFPSACRCSIFALLAACLLLFTTDAPAQTSVQQDKTGYTAAPKNGEEVSTRDTPTTFKVRVNLVLVRVVVRDSMGQVVTNLKKEDFQLTDNRKAQAISSFSMETPESHKISATSARSSGERPGAETPEDSAAIAALPQRFVALVYDDANMQIQDTVAVRDATTRLFGALAPSDRVGMYTTSGQLTQDFTEERELLNKALLGVVPRPAVGAAGSGMHDCPEMNLYEADLIENQHDAQALSVAAEDAVQCAFHGDERMQSQAQSLAEAAAARVLATGEAQVSYTYRHLEEALRRLSAMPGQRVMVLVSPGFVVTRFAETSSDLIDRANRANIVINTIDARGLFVPDVLGDIADPPHDSPRTAGFKGAYRVTAQSQQGEVLAQFADGTGGTFFHNRNDLDQGLRQAVAAPPVSYLLGFSPQNLKIDGRYHALNVTLTNKQAKYSIQARHGYFAPRTIHDPAEAAKEEIQEALFSQDEIRDLPVDLQTQFFRMDQTQARLAVLTHVNLKGIRFRKADGRNWDDLTVATAIFDQNGNFVTGGEKIVEMRLRDQTVERMTASGFTVKSSFDIKPGTYLVRLVVRDAEGAQMAARNGAVNIP